MLNLSIKRINGQQQQLKRYLQKFNSTAVQSVQKESSSDENFDKELKKYNRLTNLRKRTREKKPEREPFVKNLLLGKFDYPILTFPELELQEVRTNEKDVEELSKMLKQKHLIDVESIGNKNFRQNLSDYKALGLQCSQFLDGLDASSLESLRFLDTLSEHKLRDNLIHNELLGTQILNKFASDSIKSKYLPSIIKGESLTAFAYYESNLNDLFHMKTTATLSKDEKYWLLNGTKSFVVNGQSANLFLVLAVTESVLLGKNVKNCISAFVIDKDNCTGISVKPLDSANQLELSEISFDNVQIPSENLIGKLNDGENVLKKIIGDFRLSAGPACNSLSKRMIENSLIHFIDNSTPNYDWTSTEAVRSKLGEMILQYYVSESVTYLTGGLQDMYENQDVEIESCITKIIASEAAYQNSTTCIDLIGLPASVSTHWARKIHEELLNYLTLYETNDSQRLFIAVNGLKFAGTNISDRIKKIRNPLYFATYFLKYVFTSHKQSIDNPKLDLGLEDYLHPSLGEASKQLEYSVKRAQYAAELILARYGLECVSKHTDLRCLADVMIECFAMTAVLARASRSYCIGLQFAESEIQIAVIYCNQASKRVQEKVRNIYISDYKVNDRQLIAVGKRLVERKGFYLTSPISRFF